MTPERMAERTRGSTTCHVVRGDRYACGAKRDGSQIIEDLPAHWVRPQDRCQRIGCSNDYARADREAVST